MHEYGLALKKPSQLLLPAFNSLLFLQVRNKPLPAKREAESEAGLASRELERYQAMTERERLDFNMSEGRGGGGAGKEGPRTEHIGAPAAKKAKLLGLGGKNLLEIYMERLER